MLKVEIKEVTFSGDKTNVEVVDTYYFNGETAEADALQFSRRYNQDMPFFEGGYRTAWKPTGCYSFSLIDVLNEAFNMIKQTIQVPQFNQREVNDVEIA